MKRVIIIIILAITSQATSQTKNYKTDTIYSGIKVPYEILDSKMQVILKNLENSCEGKQLKPSDDIIDNREFRTMSVLSSFNEYGKTTIFSEFNAVIVSYFCENIDIANEISLYEFFFDSSSKATLAIKKIDALNKKHDFFYIGGKNWYYVQKNNIIYFLRAGLKDEANPMAKELKNRISSLQ